MLLNDCFHIIVKVYVERMDEYHMARRVLMAEVSGGRVRV